MTNEEFVKEDLVKYDSDNNPKSVKLIDCYVDLDLVKDCLYKGQVIDNVYNNQIIGACNFSGLNVNILYDLEFYGDNDYNRWYLLVSGPFGMKWEINCKTYQECYDTFVKELSRMRSLVNSRYFY